MFSNIAKMTYEYKEMKLADLRNRIIKENQLTPLDILKGFHTKSNIQPTYDMSNDATDIKVVEELHADLIKQISIWTELIQKTYDKLFNEDFDKLKAVVPDATVELLNDGEYNKKTYNVSIRNIQCELIHHLQYEHILKDTLEEVVKEFVTTWLEEHYPEYTIENKKSSELPIYLELNKKLEVDFDNIYKTIDSQYGSIFGGLDNIDIVFDSHLRLVSSIKSFRIPTLYKHLSRTDAETIFNSAINNIIYANNTIGTLEYFQNLEAQPITININTKTGRVELIDGYKRLLYITNQTLLDYTAPIRVFTDLDDIGFLSLLYVANLWKYTAAKKKDIAFHDRGYLFALKTRYGFEIPEIAYKHYLNIKYYSDILAVFYTYDFDGDPYHYKFIGTQMSISDSLIHHKHTINDLYIILNELPYVSSGDHKYDRNIADEIENFIIRTLGHIRRLPNSDDQKDLTIETLNRIFDDELIIKECCKKHLSSDTYIKNHLENKKLYDRIIDILLTNLS